MHALKVERVWQAEGLCPSSLRIAAHGQFAANGMTIAVDNSLGLPFASPCSPCNGNAFPLNDASIGSSTLALGRRNPHGVFVNASLSISQAAPPPREIWSRRLQQRIGQLLPPTRAYEPSPQIIGYCDESLFGPLVGRPLTAQNRLSNRIPGTDS